MIESITEKKIETSTIFIIVALTGALGAILRYSIFYLGQTIFHLPNYYETIFVNWLGSFALSYYSSKKLNLSYLIPYKKFILGGFFGSFTTFSTVIYNSEMFFHQNSFLYEIEYLLLNVIGGFLCVIIGLRLNNEWNSGDQ